jgi:hypothetical protein
MGSRNADGGICCLLYACSNLRRTLSWTLVVILDPVGMLPIFPTLTQHQAKERRRRTATT